MRVTGIIAGALSFVAFAQLVCAAGEWRGIVPLKSRRADVIKLLGPPANPHIDAYNFPDEFVQVEYAEYPCDHKVPEGWPTPPPGWNVSPDTVTAIVVRLKRQIPLSDLKIDLREFRKVRGDQDLPQHFHYLNDKEGFSITVLDLGAEGGEMVQEYGYYPTAEEEHLRCPACR